VERALKKRKHRPMFMVDLAAARRRDRVKGLSDVYLYTVDDLATVVQTGKTTARPPWRRPKPSSTPVCSFMHWMEQRNPTNGMVPLIQQIHAQADEWRHAEMARAKKLLAKGESVDAVLEALSRGLTQKMLHGTLAELRAGDADTRAATAQTVSRLFLREEPVKPPRNS
jgi:glutamyl-tRNA reductase